MYYLSMNSLDIRTNLATEEYLLNKWDKQEPLILFYIQKPSIIIGRNQDYYAELNLPYVLKEQITVTRRLSGGGTVYDDLGNLSYSIVTQKGRAFGNFKELTQPILTALQQLGVQANLTGRNDLVVEGRKFSGNAMYQKGTKLFCHGTLMYDVNLAVLPQALSVSPEKLKANNVRSVSSRVTNLKPYLTTCYQQTTAEFRDLLLCQLFAVSDLQMIQEKQYQLTSYDKSQIQSLVTSRYSNPHWIQGNHQLATYTVKQRFPIGTIEVRFELSDRRLHQVHFYGDFFNQETPNDLEKALEQAPYELTALTDLLKTFDLSRYFGPVSAIELANLIYKEPQL